MTKAIGLHFGHDAGCAILGPDGIQRYVSKERTSRVKHAMGLSFEDIELFLGDCDVIGLSTTQDVPIPIFPGHEFRVEGLQPAKYADWCSNTWGHYQNYLSWWTNRPEAGLTMNEEEFLPLTTPGGIQDPSALRRVLIRHGKTEYGGKAIPTYFFAHHLLHAEYAYFTLGDPEGTLILSCDGGWGPSLHGGGIFYAGGSFQRIIPLGTLDAWIGQFYHSIGRALGFGEDGSGKVMGLASYGRPIYMDGRLIGTRSEVLKKFGLSISPGFRAVNELVNQWLMEITGTNELSWEKATENPPPIVSDIAASAQLVVEINQLLASRQALEMARRLNLPVKKLLLAGGVALNCPANSNLAAVLDIEVDCPPAVNDEGLCIGAGVASFMELTGNYPTEKRTLASTAFLGYQPNPSTLLETAEKAGYFLAARGMAAVAQSAKLIRAGEILALFSGRSEVGPRALGHRSLIADPTYQDQWYKVNQKKGREAWRPLAPAVLESEWQLYFDRVPKASRYMLFNYRTKTRRIPAVTHFDSTARAQIVSSENGLLYDLLIEFNKLSGIPVLINTSFNGPGRPIVETEVDAFREACALNLNHMLTDIGLFKKNYSGAGGSHPECAGR